MRRFALAATLLLASCASTETYGLRSASPFERVYRTAAQTLPTLDWFIQSSDAGTGIITATRVVPGGQRTDKQLRLTLAVAQTDAGTTVRVTFVPPGMAIGTMQGEFDELTTALRLRLPDVQVVAVH